MALDHHLCEKKTRKRYDILGLHAGGMTVREVARYLRVSPDKVRSWIKAGRIGAINTSEAKCAKPRFIILPRHLEEFERKQSAGPMPKPARRRRRIGITDF